MTSCYYYTPCFTGQHIDPETGDPSGPFTKEPGVDTGSGVELPPTRTLGLSVLKYDDPLNRCVVRVPIHTLALQGWVPKTAGEVLWDYPGLPGVI
jgi:hypothetical protein